MKKDSPRSIDLTTAVSSPRTQKTWRCADSKCWLAERGQPGDVAIRPWGHEAFGRHGTPAQEVLRAKCRTVVQGGGAEARRQVELALWLELFERRADELGLGQMVREQLAATDPTRLDEFEGLDVEAGLD